MFRYLPYALFAVLFYCTYIVRAQFVKGPADTENHVEPPTCTFLTQCYGEGQIIYAVNTTVRE